MRSGSWGTRRRFKARAPTPVLSLIQRLLNPLQPGFGDRRTPIRRRSVSRDTDRRQFSVSSVSFRCHFTVIWPLIGIIFGVISITASTFYSAAATKRSAISDARAQSPSMTALNACLYTFRGTGRLGTGSWRVLMSPGSSFLSPSAYVR